MGSTLRRHLPSAQPAPQEGWHTPSPTPARSGRGWMAPGLLDRPLCSGREAEWWDSDTQTPRGAARPPRVLQRDLHCPLEAIRQEGSAGQPRPGYERLLQGGGAGLGGPGGQLWLETQWGKVWWSTPMLPTQAQQASFARGSDKGSNLVGPPWRREAPDLSGAPFPSWPAGQE